MEEGTLVVPLENEIQTLDPAQLFDPVTSRVIWQIYEGLLALDENGNVVPVLAISWEPERNYTVWRFRLRDSVYFHQVGPVRERIKLSAYDVKFSFERFARRFGAFIFAGHVKGFDEYVKGRAKEVSGFVVVDSLTFEIHLVKSEPSFIYRLTSPYLSIYPREVVESFPDNFGKEIAVGTGPFYLYRFSPTEVILKRNHDYWDRGAGGNVETIIFKVEKNQQIRLTRFLQGQYDIIQLPSFLIPQFISKDGELLPKYSGKFNLYSTYTLNVYYIGFRCDRVDVNLRRAIAMAIDRGRIVEMLLHNQGVVAKGPCLPGLQGYDSPDVLVYNPDSSRFYLSRSGYGGKEVELLVTDAPNSQEIGEIVQNQLKNAGINVKITKVDYNTGVSRIFSKEGVDMFVLSSEWVFGAPEYMLDSYYSKAQPTPNKYKYENPEFDRIFERARSSSDRKEINKLLYEAELIAQRDVPVVWLFHMKNIYLTGKRVNNFKVNPNNWWMLKYVKVS